MIGKDSGQGNSQSGNMGDGVEIGGTGTVADPETFLAGSLETGIVSLTLGAKSIGAFEGKTIPVNGEAVRGRNGFVLGTAPVFLAVVPVLMIAGTLRGFGLTEGTAEFLPESAVTIRGFPILAHSKTGLANGIAGRELLGILCVSGIEGNDSFSVIEVFYGVVNRPGVVALVTKEGTLLDGDDVIGCGEDLFYNRDIRNISGCGQFIERQTGDTVHQDMAFVSPVEFETAFIVLIGGGMDAQAAIGITFGRVIFGKPVLGKGFWIVQLCVCGNGCGIQADEGSVNDTHFIELAYQGGHKLLQLSIVQLPEKAVIGPVGRQRLENIKATIMSNDPVALQKIH